MKIVNKYLLKELAGPFFGSLLVSTAILAAGNFVQTADMVINRGVDLLQMVKIFLCFLPYVLIFTIPISVLSAVLLGFGRLSGDNEFTTLRTSGMSLIKVVVPALICGFIISLASVPLNDEILPQSEFTARKLVREAGMQSPTALIEPGVFIRGFQNYIVFTHGVQGDVLQDIRIYQPRRDQATRTIVAKKGRIIPLPEEDKIRLHLIDGTADEIAPQSPEEFYKLSFKDYYMTLSLADTVDISSIQKKAREKSIEELSAEIRELKEDNISVIPLRIELHKKIALAFSNFVFVLIGIPLAVTTHRREKFFGFAMAMLLFLIYWGIMLGGIAFSIRGLIPPWAGVWLANILLFAIGVFLLRKIINR